MKFIIHFKDPDGVYECLQEDSIRSVKEIKGLSEKEKKMLAEARREEMAQFASKWLISGECIEIEFDTEAGTATIKESR